MARVRSPTTRDLRQCESLTRLDGRRDVPLRVDQACAQEAESRAAPTRRMRPPLDQPPAAGHDEEQARASRGEALFRNVFDHAPVGILVLAPDLQIVEANRALCAMIGYSEEEVVGRPVTDFVHRDDHPAVEETRTGVLAGRDDELTTERRALCKDGRLLTVRVQSSVVRARDRTMIISQVLDVTEVRARERMLRDSEARLRTLFEEAPIGMALIAPEGTLLQVNRALASMLGRPIAELHGMQVPDLVHPEDVERTRAQILSTLGGGPSVITGESRYLRPDGSIVWGAYRSALVADAGGAPRYFVCQLVDATERKLAEDALRESEARYRGLVENSQDLIVRMDLEGNLTFVNHAWCAKFGLARDEVHGQSVLPRIVPSDQMLAAEHLRALASPPYRTRVEIRQGTVEGVRWIEWEGCGIFDDHGRVIELQGVGRDVTHAHEIEEALRASEQRYRGLVDSQRAVVLRVDPDQCITFVNDYGCRVLGLPREQILGHRGLEWVYAEDRGAIMAAFADVLRPPHRATVECRLPIADDLRWFQWEGSVVVDEGGMPAELQAIGFDVTERRAAADRLRASLEELRQSEEKLRRLAQRQVAVREEERKRLGFDLHDGVCQELIGIGILVESIRARNTGVLGRSESDLRRVTRYLGEVVEHLRLLAGELRPMLLHDLGLEGSLRSLAGGLASSGTTVEADFPSAVPRLDETTEVTVYRIAQEALTNALRHARAERVALTVAVVGDRLRLVVRDDGRGFDPARRRTSALGLLSMEERALALGGRLEISSAPRRGTTIVLDCPLALRPADAKV